MLQRPPDPNFGERNRLLGRALTRREDLRLVTGQGRFTGDIDAPGTLHLVFARAEEVGRILSLDTEAARAIPGVCFVLTGADVADRPGGAVNPVVSSLTARSFRLLAQGRTGFVGEAVAAVVADTTETARDAAEAVITEVEPAPVPDEPAYAQDWHAGDVETAFRNAAHVVSTSFADALLAPAPLEPRGVLAVPEGDGLLVYLPTQSPHRARTDLAGITGLPLEKVRIVAPDVGGAFGGKASLHPEEAVACLCALRLGKPVRWVATRLEEFLAAPQGRGIRAEGRMALSASGKILAVEARFDCPVGAWMTFSAAVPGRNAGRILPGPYDVRCVDIRSSGRFTATPPVGIYRGAGRPEAAMLLERLIEEAARATGRDPVALRRANLVRRFPHRTPTGETLDSGDYAALLDKACAAADWAGLRRERVRRRRRGEVVGLGMALYVEPCGHGKESARIALRPDGTILAGTGSTAQGQGRETAVAQIVADELGLPLDAVAVSHGDTGSTPPGIGALASRSTPIGGSALVEAARRWRREVADLAGRLGVAADAELADIARAAVEAGAPLPVVTLDYEPLGEAWASGCAIASLSIDRDTGVPRLERLVLVDDAGVIVNPLLAEGQLRGGIAQAVGAALMEAVVRDEHGQLVTGSFMDYAMPRASDMPPITLGHAETPTPANTLGAKGIGEAGAIGVPAAIINAALDALAPFGVRHLDMPLRSGTLWAAMHKGER
jgi:carbon-monoxide dehydrogenase large subunit